MRGSSTIALAELRAVLGDRLAEHCLRVRLDRLSIVVKRFWPWRSGVALSVSIACPVASRMIVCRPGRAGELGVVLELEPAEALVVGACEADHRRRDRVLRIGAPLLRIRADAGEVLREECGRNLRIGEAGDVDEPLVLVEQLRIELVRVGAEKVLRRECDPARVGDHVRVGVDRRVLLADRELNSAAVENRAAPRRRRHRLLVHRCACLP